MSWSTDKIKFVCVYLTRMWSKRFLKAELGNTMVLYYWDSNFISKLNVMGPQQQIILLFPIEV